MDVGPLRYLVAQVVRVQGLVPVAGEPRGAIVKAPLSRAFGEQAARGSVRLGKQQQRQPQRQRGAIVVALGSVRYIVAAPVLAGGTRNENPGQMEKAGPP